MKALDPFRLAAAEWIDEHGSDALVDELKQAVADERRVKLGTTNTLILLEHIENLEAELARCGG